jgi:hypothetical protein
MDHTYDIFRTSSDDGRPVWIEAVATLEQAKERLRSLPSLRSAEYRLYDPRAGKFIESELKRD